MTDSAAIISHTKIISDFISTKWFQVVDVLHRKIEYNTIWGINGFDKKICRIDYI